MRSQVRPSVIRSLLASDKTGRTGQRMVRGFISAWDGSGPESMLIIILLQSAMTNSAAARLLRDFDTEVIRPSDSGHALHRLRLSLVGSELIGLAVARYILRLEPIASSTADGLAEALGPIISLLIGTGVERAAGADLDAEPTTEGRSAGRSPGEWDELSRNSHKHASDFGSIGAVPPGFLRGRHDTGPTSGPIPP